MVLFQSSLRNRIMIENSQVEYKLWSLCKQALVLTRLFIEGSMQKRSKSSTIIDKYHVLRSVGITEPSVDWWFSGSNETITRACHGFKPRLAQRHDRLPPNGWLRASQDVPYPLAWNQSSCSQQGLTPGQNITSSRYARVIVLLEPLSHQSTNGSVVPTRSKSFVDFAILCLQDLNSQNWQVATVLP